ncbi:MAG: hypothetical protein HYX63_12445 [Gammaproteobacteria bacterium]|nr:hypothetical protein [Gammaproteobacteria bacterium]
MVAPFSSPRAAGFDTGYMPAIDGPGFNFGAKPSIDSGFADSGSASGFAKAAGSKGQASSAAASGFQHIRIDVQ